jgi:hypothetical protein
MEWGLGSAVGILVGGVVWFVLYISEQERDDKHETDWDFRRAGWSGVGAFLVILLLFGGFTRIGNGNLAVIEDDEIQGTGRSFFIGFFPRRYTAVYPRRGRAVLRQFSCESQNGTVHKIGAVVKFQCPNELEAVQNWYWFFREEAEWFEGSSEKTYILKYLKIFISGAVGLTDSVKPNELKETLNDRLAKKLALRGLEAEISSLEFLF